jgi:hypothetical protein
MVETKHVWPDVLISLTLLTWLLATPYLLFGAVITAAPFFGDTPTAEETRQAHLLLYAGLTCGFGLPLAGLAIAYGAGRRATAWIFVGAFVLTAVVIGYVAAQ